MGKKISIITISVVCGIFALSFIFLGIINYGSSSSTVLANLKDTTIPLLTDDILTNIDNRFLHAENVATVMSHNSFLRNWVLNSEENNDEIVDYLDSISKDLGYTVSFFVSHKSKKYYHNKGVLKTISEDDPSDSWYYDFIESGCDLSINMEHDEDRNHELTIFMNHRVEDSMGNIIGVAGVAKLMDFFAGLLLDVEEKYNKSIYFVDQNGEFKVHSDSSYILKRNIYDILGINSVAARLLSRMEESETNVFEYEFMESKYIASSRYIEKLGWYLVIEHNKSEELKEANMVFFRTIILGIILLLFTIITVSSILRNYNNKLEAAAVTDPLTNIFNRRELNRQMDKLLFRKKRVNFPLTFLIIDIDFFKSINDFHGHDIGDMVLKEFTRVVLLNIRKYDIPFRLGGDEFAIIFESTMQDSYLIAERISNGIKKLNFRVKDDKKVNITLSMGLYESCHEDSADTIYKNADIALYNAKESGRDCIKNYKEVKEGCMV